MPAKAIDTTPVLERSRTMNTVCRVRLLRVLLPLTLVFSLLGVSTRTHAAYAVYAGSLTSPTQAQEEAQRINRVLNITSATYERATVRGEVFWRVRVGIFPTQNDARAAQQRFKSAGLGDTWMREVPDSELSAPPASRPTTPTRTTVSIDSTARAWVDSLSQFARRAVDSLETASQRRIERILERMQSALAEEVIRKIEEDRSDERSTYVTQMEQSQMTRALRDELYANLDALRDSLNREHEERQRLEALKPRLSGTISTLSSLSHIRPDGGSIRTSGTAAQIAPRVVIEWGSDRSQVLLDARSTLSTVEVAQAYVTWDVVKSTPSIDNPASRGITTTIGAGRFSPPYGLEPTSSAALLAPWASEISRTRIAPTGIWVVPASNEGFRLLLMPYGEWSVDDERANGLAQMRLSPGAWRIELTVLDERETLPRNTLSYDTRGHFVVEWNTPTWVVGTEFMAQWTSNVTPNIDETGYGVLALVHWRFAPQWGWTLRGDYIDRTMDQIGGETVRRTGTILTGPTYSINSRFKLRAAYEFSVIDHRDVPRGKLLRDYGHVVGVGFAHAF